MSRSSRSSSRARPASVVPSGTSGAGASSADRRARSRSRCGAARPPSRAAGGSRPRRPRAAAAARAAPASSLLEPRRACGGAPRAGRWRPPRARLPTRRRGAPAAPSELVDAGGEVLETDAHLGVAGAAPLERRPGCARPPRVVPGRAPAGRRPRRAGARAPGAARPSARCAGRVATLRRHRGGALVELELHERARLEQRLCFRRLGFEGGKPHLERGDAVDVAGPLRVQARSTRRASPRLRRRAACVRRRRAPGPGRRPSSSCTAAPLAFGGVGFARPSRRSSSLVRGRQCRGGGVARGERGARVPLGVVERGPGGGERVAPEAPGTAAAEAVAVAGHDGHARVARARGRARPPVAVDEHARREQARQPRSQTRAPGSGRRSARGRAPGTRGCRERGDRRGRRRRAPAPRGVAVGEALDQRLPGRRRAVDDDRAQRVAERAAHRGLGAGVDLEVVDQRADARRRGRRAIGGRHGCAPASSAAASASARACHRGRVGLGGAHGCLGVGAGGRSPRTTASRAATVAARRARQPGADPLVRRTRARRARRRARRGACSPGPGARRPGRARRRCGPAPRVGSRDRGEPCAGHRRWRPGVGLSANAPVRGGEVVLGALRPSARSSASAPSSRPPARRAGVATSAGVGDERLDHAFVGHRGELALEPAPLLGDQRARGRGRARAATPTRVEHVGDVVVARRR